MTKYEYKVITAPTKGRKAPGAKTAEARFAVAVEAVMNELAADGWQYLRSDLLPSEERQGLTSSQTVYRSLLVFRREVKDASSTASEEQTTDHAAHARRKDPPIMPPATATATSASPDSPTEPLRSTESEGAETARDTDPPR